MISVPYLPLSERKKAPGWWPTPQDNRGSRSVWFRCPNGHVGTLWVHEIAPDGTVSPSVACPNPECSFHDSIRLENWPAAEGS